MKRIFLPLSFMLILNLFACQTPPSTPANTANPAIPTAPQSPLSPTATTLALPEASSTPELALKAILQEVKGSVEAKDLNDAAFSNAENGRTIQEEGQVRTYEDGYTRIDLSTGTLIRMAPQSYFTLLENTPKEESLFTRIKLEVGQIWVILNGGSLEVETPSGQASVRGSYMMIEINPETQDVIITCLEGQCSLENPAGIVDLRNGQRAKLDLPDKDEDFHIPTVSAMSERDFAEWLFFAPESEEIFPELKEEGIVPWDEWENYIPQTDADFFDLLEQLPGDPFRDGDLLPEDDNLLPRNEDGHLPGDGERLPDDGDLLPSDGDLSPGNGELLPGDGDLLPGGDDGILPGDGDLLPHREGTGTLND